VSDLLLVNEHAPESTVPLRPTAESGRRYAARHCCGCIARQPSCHGGNAPGRPECRSGEFGAVVLARAGVERLGLDLRGLHVYELNHELWLPAPGQGAVAIQARADDDWVLDLLGRINDGPTRQAAELERRLLANFEGGCHTAFGAWARDLGEMWELRRLEVSRVRCSLCRGRLSRTCPARAGERSCVAQPVERQEDLPVGPLVILTQEPRTMRLAQLLALRGIDTLSYPASRCASCLSPLRCRRTQPGDFHTWHLQPPRVAVRPGGRAAGCYDQWSPASVPRRRGRARLLRLEPDDCRDRLVGLARAISSAFPLPQPLLLVRGKSTGHFARTAWSWLGRGKSSCMSTPVHLGACCTGGWHSRLCQSAAAQFSPGEPHLLTSTTCVAIGETTAKRLRELGATSIVQAAEPTHEALVDAVCQLFRRATKS
jgi:hypothetical protein